MENKIVRHVLIARISQDITGEVFAEFIQDFRDLSKKIEGILSFEHGPNNSPEGLNQGMNYVFTLTFINAESRDAYLTHPDHVQFANSLGKIGIFETLMVVDYTPQ